MAGIELELIKWLQGRAVAGGARKGSRGGLLATSSLGIDDDMAIIDLPGGRILLSTDMMVDGVHFDAGTQSLKKIGRKALACGLSDCAAMAVRPAAALISLALPSEFTLGQAKELLEGVEALATEYDVNLVGGDTTSGSRSLVLDVCVAAVPFDGIAPVRRSGARVGDRIYVTGKLGGSSLGRHLDFRPRVHESHKLAENLGEKLHAMMDITDGVSLDLWRLCEASGTGARLIESALSGVASEAAIVMADSDGRPALDHVLEDGEDFELLLAVDPAAAVSDIGIPLFGVGWVAESGFVIERSGGEVERLEPRGYTH
jgi:thiamine-monophosphate kinase